jgi:uncharacterized protein
MNTITQIYIYPIKGMKGISVSSAYALSAGMQHDRRWMLVDGDGRFVSQRNDTRLALLEVDIEGENLTIKYQDDQFSVAIDLHSDQILETEVWDDHATCYIVSDEANAWFSRVLEGDYRLVKMVDEHSRQHYATQIDTIVDVSLADGYPYLFIGTASVDLLNEKLPFTILVDRFRPNIVIQSHVAHEEDELGVFALGKARFQNIKPCARCQVVTIDQQTGDIHKEVLQTLSQYRKIGNKVVFGTNVICIEEGLVSVGDLLLGR